jgi:hypothetical protein
MLIAETVPAMAAGYIVIATTEEGSLDIIP